MVSAAERFEEIRKADREKAQHALTKKSCSEQMQKSTILYSKASNEIKSRIHRKQSINEPLDGFTMSPLLWACTIGDIDLIELILESSFYLNINELSNGYSALHVSVSGLSMNDDESFNVAKLLLDNGIDVNCLTLDWISNGSSNCKSSASISECGGKSALHFAAENGDISLCRLLTQYGCETLLWDKSGMLAEDYAEINGHTDCLTFLQSIRIRKYPNYILRNPSQMTQIQISQFNRSRIHNLQQTNRLQKNREIQSTIRREFDWNGLLDMKIKDVIHPNVYQIHQEYKNSKSVDAIDRFVNQIENEQIYQFSLFSESYLEKLTEQFQNLEKYLQTHPFLEISLSCSNSLALVGWQDFMDRLQEYIIPITFGFYPEFELDTSGFVTIHGAFCKFNDKLPTSQSKSDIVINSCFGNNTFDGGKHYFYKFNSFNENEEPPSYPDESSDKLIWCTPIVNQTVMYKGSQYHGIEEFKHGEQWNIVFTCHASNQYQYSWKNLREEYIHSQKTKNPIELLDLVKDFISLKKEYINEQDHYGYSLLHFSVLSGEIETAKYLLDENIDPYIYDRNGFIALHYAVTNDDIEMLQCIIPYYLDLNVPTLLTKSTRLVQIYISGQTPLHLACQRVPPAKECAKLLIQHGANCNLQDSTGNIPCLSILNI